MPVISQATAAAFSDPLPEAVDAVIIGAGIIGTAAAYFLAQRGVSVLLCEKGRVAGEQSCRNWGWVRQQGRDRAELPIMMEANRIWRDLAAQTGEKDLGFTRSGCLYVAQNEAQLAEYERWTETAKQHQLDTRLLSRDEVANLVAGVRGSWCGGMHTASDGCAEPFVAVPALARAARRAGAIIVEDCAVRTLATNAGCVAGVTTEKGTVRAERVLLAGGAWSTHFLGNLDIDLPQLMVRSTAGRTRAGNGTTIPNLALTGLAMRRRADGGYTVSTGDIAEHYLVPKSFKYFTRFLALAKISARDVRLRLKLPPGYPGGWHAKRHWSGDEVSPFEQMRILNPPPSPIVHRRLTRRLPEHAPGLAELGIAEMWAGMIDVTPDAVPFICEAPAPQGLFIGTGMSGHGFGIGPAVGRVLADLMQGRPSGHDLTRFRFDRFSDGSAIEPGPY